MRRCFLDIYLHTSSTRVPAVQTLVLSPLRRRPGTVEAVSGEAFALLSGVADFNRALRRRGIWSGIGKKLIEYQVSPKKSIGVFPLTVQLLVVDKNKFEVVEVVPNKRSGFRPKCCDTLLRPFGRGPHVTCRLGIVRFIALGTNKWPEELR